MRQLGIALLAALALAVPIGAAAGGSGGLNVEASLGGCGVGGAKVVCRINVSYGAVEGGEYYTASVTAPTGGVQDFGRIGGAGGGGTTLWVPYVGDGTYTVQVTAYGSEDDGETKVIDEDEDEGEADGEERDGLSPGKPRPGADDDGRVQGGDGIEPHEAPEANGEGSDEESTEPVPEPGSPEHSQGSSEALPPCDAAEDGDGEADEEAAASVPPVECTEPTVGPSGPCCP